MDYPPIANNPRSSLSREIISGSVYKVASAKLPMPDKSAPITKRARLYFRNECARTALTLACSTILLQIEELYVHMYSIHTRADRTEHVYYTFQVIESEWQSARAQQIAIAPDTLEIGLQRERTRRDDEVRFQPRYFWIRKAYTRARACGSSRGIYGYKRGRRANLRRN